MPSTLRRIRQGILGTALFALVAGLVALAGGGAQAASLAPVADRTSSMARADALPTVQIDGVAWAQVVVGNTVYVGGDFTTARPAGAALGASSSVPRSDMLAYDITTGNLIASFAPSFNGSIRALAASPDGTRLYVGGNFTAVDGQSHQRIAAINLSTGAVDPTFTASANSTVRALAATNSTLYAGGLFTAASGSYRSRLAAFTTAGAITSWNPGANDSVYAMTMTPDNSRVIVGGAFTTVAGASEPGSASLDATTAAVEPWAVNQIVRNNSSGNTQAAIWSLSHDGSRVYGTAYKYLGIQQKGMLEGSFAADPTTGNVIWIEACRGDTYSSFASPSALYTVGHAHNCSFINAFGQATTNQYHFALAFSLDATQVDNHDTDSPGSYSDFGGQPAPSLIDWFPDFTAGTYTGMSQAGWSVTGNSSYVVIGGEFLTVNGTKQQGLVRFSNSPGKQGPQYGGANFTPTVTATTATSASFSFTANTDRDDRTLTYTLLRDGTAVATQQAAATFWSRPTLTFTDSGLTGGQTYQYRLRATDSDGNTVTGNPVSVTTPTAVTTSTLVSAASGYCMDIYGARTGNGTSIIAWPCHGGSNQNWTSGADGTLRSLGKCLTATWWGGAVLQSCSSGNASQQWALTPDGSVKGSAGCLTTSGGTAQLTFTTCRGLAAQTWIRR